MAIRKRAIPLPSLNLHLLVLDLVKEAKADQQQEVRDLQAALTDAANKTLQAHGWDLHGYNHRWQTYKPPADNLAQITEAAPPVVAASSGYPPAAEISAATTHALGEPKSLFKTRTYSG